MKSGARIHDARHSRPSLKLVGDGKFPTGPDWPLPKLFPAKCRPLAGVELKRPEPQIPAPRFPGQVQVWSGPGNSRPAKRFPGQPGPGSITSGATLRSIIDSDIMMAGRKSSTNLLFILNEADNS